MSRPALLLLVLAACARPGPAGAPAPRTLRTVRGIVALTGSEPFSQLVFRPEDGSPQLLLDGSVVARLRAASGLDVELVGERDGQRFLVQTFIVRGSDGQHALDGVLLRTPSGFALRLQDGTVVGIKNLPPALADAVDQRVWLAAPLDAGAGLFGRIPPS